MEVVQHISPRAEQLLSEYGLGQVRAEYSDNMLRRGLIFTALLPVGLVMLGLTLPTLLAPALTDGNWWERLGGLTYFLLGGSCFSVLGLIGVIFLTIALWKGDTRLYLGEKGFISARRQIETVMYWNTVAEIHRHMLFMQGKTENVPHVTSVCTYTFVPTEGKKCAFAADPGPTIEETVTAYQFPRVLENYVSGKTLSFGWLALDSNGLHLTPEGASASKPTIMAKLPGVGRTSQKLHGTCVASGEHFLPWQHLNCCWIDETRSTLILSRRGERKHWAIVPLYQVANPALCLALFEYARAGDTHEIA